MVTLVMEPLAASVNAPASLVTVPVDVPVTMTVAPAMGEPDCRSTTVPWSNDWAASVAGMISDSRADTTRCMRHDPGSSWTGDSSAPGGAGSAQRARTASDAGAGKMDAMLHASIPDALRIPR